MRKIIELASFSLYIQPASASGFVRGGRVSSAHAVVRPVNLNVFLTIAKSATDLSIPQVDVRLVAQDNVELSVRGH